MQTGSVKGIAYFYADNDKGMANVRDHCFHFHRCIFWYFLVVHWRSGIHILSNDHIHPPPQNSRDVTIKRVHSEKRGDIDGQVVAVPKVAVFVLGVGIVSNCMPFCRLYIQEYRGQFLLKSLCIKAVPSTTKMFHVKKTVPDTNGVSSERGTSWQRHS